ncbi:hypothetical protein RMQ97_03715 [Maricaulis sp. D1M11]|uniref:hypothetical protein n=1 Tax=Maricaulis sp. D1M11 TaxID=3076117 RepID=UPI0039B47394
MGRFTLRTMCLAALTSMMGLAAAAEADNCQIFAQHRDAYLSAASAGMDQAITNMAQQRNVSREAAAFYWGSQLMQQGDPTSLRQLAQLALTTYYWDGADDRSETSMVRIFEERGGDYAGFLAGLMLSDDRGPQDLERARSLLERAQAAGNTEAGPYIGLFDACHNASPRRGRRWAMN